MTNDMIEIPDSLQDLPPVGMLTVGGLALNAMASVAQRVQLLAGGLADWEAFHYERISDAQFEITGGVATKNVGVKKWAGAHDTVVIDEADVLAEMRAVNGGAVADTTSPRISAPVSTSSFTPSSNEQQRASNHVQSQQSTTRYLNVVLALPEDETSRQRVIAHFHLQANILGASVQACSLHDEFSAVCR